jgi:cell division protease FtsH
MSKEVGLFFANEGDSSPFVGREMGTPGMREYSEATAAMLDETVRNILAERMQVAVRLLTKNREILDRLARALLKYETLDKKCIQAAIDGREVPPPDTHKPVSPSRSEERNDGEPVVGKPEPEGAGAA